LEAEARGLIESALRGEVPLEPFMQDVSTEAANKIIRAIVCRGEYIGIMNLPNDRQITNLPHGVIVETYGVIDATGAHAITYGAIPAGVQNILEQHVHQQELTVEAAQKGSWEIALQVLLNDPLSSRLTIPQAKQLLEELLKANKQYLPLFFA